MGSAGHRTHRSVGLRGIQSRGGCAKAAIRRVERSLRRVTDEAGIASLRAEVDAAFAQGLDQHGLSLLRELVELARDDAASWYRVALVERTDQGNRQGPCQPRRCIAVTRAALAPARSGRQ